MKADREEIITLVESARNTGARQSKACETVGISAKTFQRWSRMKHQQDGRVDARHSPKNKMTDLECQQIINLANSAPYSDLSPSKIVPKLADNGLYLASETTFYRVLKKHHQLTHRGQSKPKQKRSKPIALRATAPNQLYSWDITYLPTTVKGLFFYLYLVMDVFSRKIVGWQIHREESSERASHLMTDICLREGIAAGQVTLHSDNGSPMKGATMLATLQSLGVVPSYSRPSVSNDNPYSESLFRTLKYNSPLPNKPFAELTAARQWVNAFVQWYNAEHLHSSIRFVTPNERHMGLDKLILAKRAMVYEKAKARHPERWSGKTRDWSWQSEVHLNPTKENDSKTEVEAA